MQVSSMNYENKKQPHKQKLETVIIFKIRIQNKFFITFLNIMRQETK
jgi:hypothetical protein